MRPIQLITEKHVTALLKAMGIPEERIRMDSVSISGEEQGLLCVQMVALINPDELGKAWSVNETEPRS